MHYAKQPAYSAIGIICAVLHECSDAQSKVTKVNDHRNNRNVLTRNDFY